MNAARRRLTLDEYLLRTRGRGFNIIVVVAALVFYELGLIVTGLPQRNAADAILGEALALVHEHAALGFRILLLVLFGLAIGLHLRRGRSISRYLGPFLLESLAWASVLSPTVLFLAEPSLANPAAGRVVLDVGAGVYEEIVFRFLILRGLCLLLGIDPYHAFADETGHATWPRFQAAGRILVAVLVSSSLFAVYHHVGENADAWSTALVAFRFLAGLLFSGLYFVRGLGVCVYAHAFYDILVNLSA